MVRTKTSHQKANTRLTLKECADVFRAASQESGFAQLRGRMQGIHANFYTPDMSNPFSTVDTNDPAFAVGFKLSSGMDIHMYVYELDGDRRRVEFFAADLSSFAGKRNSLISKYVGALCNADSTARVID